jgi:hypothetical protein
MSEHEHLSNYQNVGSDKKKTSRLVRFPILDRSLEQNRPLERPEPRLALKALGIRSITDLEKFLPYRHARLLIAAGKNEVTLPDIAEILNAEYVDRPLSESAIWPIRALRGLAKIHAAALERAGIHTIADIAELGSYVDRMFSHGNEPNGFYEPPSAPAELLPSITGAISTSKRYSNFVKNMDIRGLRFGLDLECIEYSPLAHKHAVLNPDIKDLILKIKPETPELKTLIKKLHPLIADAEPYGLGEIFTKQECPVIYLGYLISHKQEWINLGTYLGDVKKSISLAPGESRQIAFLDWDRRQTMDRTEDTGKEEQLRSTVVHSRALEEITQAVAIEQQLGGTETEASTSTLALSAVGSAALAGGLAGGAGGALIGGGIGSIIEPGGGTAIGAGIGGLLGGAIGLAGGAVYTSSQLLGTIMATSEGDREIAAELNQRITQSTQQNSGLIQSLYSTIVLDDVQAEQVQASTRNITNYNHMHTLNIMYYEVLQHYLTHTHVTKVEPLIFLPYRYMNFTGFKFIRDYWDVIREYLDDDLKMQGDTFFADENGPSMPDLIPVPPEPVPPTIPEPARIENLVIDLFYDAKDVWGYTGSELGLNVKDKAGEEYKGDRIFLDKPAQGEGHAYYAEYKFDFIYNAHLIDKVVISKKEEKSSDLNFKIRIRTGQVRRGSNIIEDLSGQVIVTNKKIKASEGNGDFGYTWRPIVGYESELADLMREYERLVQEREDAKAENQGRQQAYDQLVKDKDRFKARLENIIVRRRHYFTRIILNAMESEQLKGLLDRLLVYAEEDANLKIPLHAIAHTQPIAMTSGAFVLKLKRFTPEYARRLAPLLGMQEGTKVDPLININLRDLLRHSVAIRDLEQEFQDPENDDIAHVYLPTGGLFAEALLGQANSAEYHNLERHSNWQDTPIPHQPTAIEPVSLASRAQQQSLSVTEPTSNLNLVNAPQFPDPTGMSGILAAIQNGSMFRDMSKAAELAGMLDNLMALSGQMGQAASQMTGEAAQEAMQSAVQMGQMASKLAEQIFQQAMSQAGNAYKNRTDKGATIKALKDNLPEGPGREQAIRETLGIPNETPGTNGTGNNGALPDTPSPDGPVTDEKPVDKGPLTTDLPALPEPGQVIEVEPQPSEAARIADERVTELIQQGGAADKAEMVEISLEWYNDSVLPRLQQASNDDRFLIPALREWLDWLEKMNLQGIDPASYSGDPNLAAEENEARIWATGGLQNAVLQASQRAIETNNLDYFGDAIYWSSLAEMWGLATDVNRLQIYDVIDDFPLKVDIFDIQYPPEVPLDEPITFSAKAALQIGDNPHILQPALFWQLDVTEGNISGLSSGQTNSNGGFSTVITRASDNNYELTVTVIFKDGPQDFKTTTHTFRPALPS